MNGIKAGRLAKLTAFIALALAVGAGANTAGAVEIDLGALVPSPGGCSLNGGGPNSVCPNSQSFTANGSTFTATGFGDTFVTKSALTLKPVAGNGLGESGLGENATASAPCSDKDCEAAPGTSVAITATRLITDVIIGSVQSPEQFQVWTGSSIGSLADLTGTLTLSTCTHGPAVGTCLVSIPGGTLAVGLLDLKDTSGGTNSDTLITAVSQSSAVPEPTAIAVFGTALVGIGLASRRRNQSNDSAIV